MNNDHFVTSLTDALSNSFTYQYNAMIYNVGLLVESGVHTMDTTFLFQFGKNLKALYSAYILNS